MNRRPGGKVRVGLLAAGLGLATLGGLAGCSSGHADVAVGGSSSTSSGVLPPTSPETVPPTTAANQMATVPDCGTGAYKPATLLIVCGDGTTTATDVSWTSWTSSAASGTGQVHLVTGGRSVTASARLDLSAVVQGSEGPQYSLLTVTWTGSSPDGHPTDTFKLSTAAG